MQTPVFELIDLEKTVRTSRVIMLTTFDLDEYVYDAHKAGASGFLRKDAPPERLLTFVRSAGRDDPARPDDH
jgi:DNA-binding NarL/FixJ family response regulator